MPVNWRQLRSKIWWLAEFCNSHCVSHFAAFFIGMGTKISVVENFLGLLLLYTMIDNCKNQLKIDDLGGLMMTEMPSIMFNDYTRDMLPWGTLIKPDSKSLDYCVNDPSAGSPTETLLRLLLPLSDKVYITSRSRFKPELSPEGSPDHSIGRSDGRCVQRAGTYSAQADDLCLQGIPRSRSIIAKIYPQHDTS